MLKEERFEHILIKLRSAHKVSFEGIAKDLHVSEDTIRRDIDMLHKSGLLVKVRGGAISPIANPLSFQDRESVFADGKNIIALKARQLLKKRTDRFYGRGHNNACPGIKPSG